jgi:DNA-directed RNA polymerase subunit RPC12/RpoP
VVVAIIAGVLAAFVGLLVFEDTRSSRAAWRRRVCPHCKSRRLTELASFQWQGPKDGGSFQTYRCRRCQAELFAEYQGTPVPMAEHATWREAKQAEVWSFPSFDGELPVARVRGRGRRSRRALRP